MRIVRPFVAMMEATKDRNRDDAPVTLPSARSGRWVEVEGSVGARLVVIGHDRRV